MRSLNERAATTTILLLVSIPAFSQAPPSYPPPELEGLVSRIALYPDSLLAQVLAAATFADQVPDAARWADQHHYLTGDVLARAIADDHLPWDPSVQALLPFPSVLAMMASDMSWTNELGNAFLAQSQDVMDAVQRMRQQARDYGYLRTNGQIVVSSGPYIEIRSVNPALIYVPYYDPRVVFVRPGPRVVVGGGVTFGFGISIGPAFGVWGWGGNRFDWGEHRVFINSAPWGRTWVNRPAYIHPYAVPRYEAPRPVEPHVLHERSEREREQERNSRRRVEEHHERDDRRR